MRKVPERFQKFSQKYSKIFAAYESLAGECHKVGPLNERERTLVKLGVAAGSHMEGAVHSQVRKALDLGINPDEIRHAILLSTTAIGFPGMMAAFTWAEDILNLED
jgi:4-carboxymuconolactone decarboxylase